MDKGVRSGPHEGDFAFMNLSFSFSFSCSKCNFSGPQLLHDFLQHFFQKINFLSGFGRVPPLKLFSFFHIFSCFFIFLFSFSKFFYFSAFLENCVPSLFCFFPNMCRFKHLYLGFTKDVSLRSRCSTEMWCLDDRGRDSWNWVGPPTWERS